MEGVNVLEAVVFALLGGIIVLVTTRAKKLGSLDGKYVDDTQPPTEFEQTQTTYPKGFGPLDLRLVGERIGHLADVDCFDFVETMDGKRYYFAGKARMLPNGESDPKWRPEDCLIIKPNHLYLPDRIHAAPRR